MAEPLQAPAPANPLPPEAPAKILLVDDQPANLLALQAILADLGPTLIEARSGEQALRRLLDDDFAVVLLDVQMPGLDGFETAKLIRDRRSSRHTPIIFLTAFETDRPSLIKAYSLGAVDFLVKPLVPVILRTKVAWFVELYEKNRQIKRQSELLRQSERSGFERKLAEENALLRAQKERFRVTLGSIGDAVITTDTAGRITFLNPIAQTLIGWTELEAVGQSLESVFRIINETTRQTVPNPATRVLQEGTIVGLANHTLLVAKDGTERPIDDSAAPIRDDQGAISGVVLVFRDVTERRNAEAALRESEARKTAILKASLDAIVTIDSAGKVIGFNPAAEALFGYTQAEAVGQDMDALIVPPSLREGHRLGLAHYLATGEGPILNRRLEMPARCKDGAQLMVELVITRLDGSVRPFFTGFVRDVTAQKKAEAALAERVRLLALGTDVGKALTQGQTLPQTLKRCAEAMVEHLHGAFARIWTFNVAENMLELQASAGLYTHLDGSHSRVPVGQFKIGRIAQERRPHLTNTVIGDPQVAEQEWARREGLIAFAGYPLVVEDRLAGVVAMFARQPLSSHTLDAIATVADELAIGIERKRAEQEISRLLALEQERSERLRQVATASLTINSATTPHSVIGIIQAEAQRILGALQAIVQLQADLTAAPEDALTAPLIGRGGQPLGRIHLTQKEGGVFTEDDAAILTQLAHMAAVAFDNARLYEELREGDRRKDEFLATLAHELRNPLAPIRNSLQVMRLSSNNPQMMESSRAMIERQVKQMVRLVDDLLDLSRISRGKMQLRLERVDLGAVLTSALETSKPIIEQFNHTLTVQMPKEPIPLQADATRLAQVFLNLLNNAAKYTEPGGRIELSAERAGTDVLVRVRDNGVGISAEMLPRVFEMFTQVDRTLERAQGGLGIGLTLVRRLVEMHGGAVEAASAGSGLGSEFRVRLRVATTPSVEAATRSRDLPAAIAPRRRILVVDDNRDSAESLAAMLQLLGNDVCQAHDGIEAVDLAATYQPDVVLLDIGLPRLNGYEAARRIREQSAERKIILIALTGWGQAEDRRRSREAGFDHHLVKPVDPAALEKLLAAT